MNICGDSTEVCKKSQTKVVIESTFTSSVIAANEFYLFLNRDFESTFIFYLQLTYPPSASTIEHLNCHNPTLHLTPFHKTPSLQTPSALSKLTATMVKWDEEHKLKLLLAIIEHLNPTSLPWDKLASAMGPEFTSEAVR